MPKLNDFLGSPDTFMQQTAQVLAKTFGHSPDSPAAAAYVPGRIEFLGKHTDYAGGRSLLLAVDKGFRLVAVPRQDNLLRVSAGQSGTDIQQFRYGETPAHAPGHWVNYVATVARRVNMNFAGLTGLRGADIAFISDLPVAAGMSSSSALMVAFFLGISAVNRLDNLEVYRRQITSRVKLAEYLGCVENGQSYGPLTGEAGVGTFGGSEDHTAMLCCKAGELSQFSFAPSVFERQIPFPAEVAIVVASSGVEAVKTAAARQLYNRASLRARKATAAYNSAAGANCRNLREIALRAQPNGLEDALAAISKGTPPAEKDLDLPGRFRQFFIEDQHTIPAVGDLLAKGDYRGIGKLIDISQAGAIHGLQNQVDETIYLPKSALAHGAMAASAFGAGFGGSVWAMIEKAKTDEFMTAWKKDYLARFPARAGRADFFTTVPGPAATIGE